MPSRAQFYITANWVDEAPKKHPEYPRGVERYNYSYSLWPEKNRLVHRTAGEMARLVRTRGGRPRLWLLNGDRMAAGGWGPNTRATQDNLRTLTRKTRIPVCTLPYSALEAAGIDLDSIYVIEELPEWWETVNHDVATLAEVPEEYRRTYVYGGRVADGHYEDIPPGDDGRYHWETSEHHLGACVFRASWKYDQQGSLPLVTRRAGSVGITVPRMVTGTSVFVTGFDANELPRRQLWFMAQLPGGSRPHTVAEALEMLKPPAVKDAERAGREVLRQGDVFAIKTSLSARELAARGAVPVQPLNNGGRYVNDSHTATKVLMLPDGTFYVQGVMRHQPRGSEWGGWRWQARRAEHKNLTLGDKKTWFLVAFNTVPRNRSFSPRAWSLGGNVD